MVSIQTCWKTCTESKTLQPSTTLKDKNRYNRHILPYWNEYDMETIKFKDILDYRRHLSIQNLSPQSIKHCLTLLRSTLRRSAQLEVFNAKIPHFEMPKIDNRRMRFLSEDEVQKLLFALRIESELWHDITLFALNTGMRAGEIFSLKRTNVNLVQNNIIIYKCKNACARIIPLNQITFELVEKYLQKQTAYLFCKPLSPEKMITEVSSTFRRIVTSTDLNINISNTRDKIVFHSLRHTFASWLVQHGVPLIVVSNLLGHKSLQMTMHYSHLAPENDIKAINFISDTLLSSYSIH